MLRTMTHPQQRLCFPFTAIFLQFTENLGYSAKSIDLPVKI
jgi:hypothetical protein